MEIQGRIIQVLPLQSGTAASSGKAWKKQEYILETQDAYPKKICFNLWGDNVDRFALQVGEEVTVQIDIESREYNGRWYTDVKAWRVDRGMTSLAPGAPVGQQYTAAAPQPSPASYGQTPASPLQGAPTTSSGFGGGYAPASGANENDDLPF